LQLPDQIIYGGSFDPPHLGHIQAVLAAAKQFPNAEISVMPSPVPASTDSRAKDLQTPFVDRFQMTCLAFAPYLSEKINVSDFESKLPGPHFTQQTLQALKDQSPNKRLAILIGEDQLKNFGHWHNPLGILQLADVLVIRRQSETYITEDVWQNIAKELGAKVIETETGCSIEGYYGCFFLVEAKIENASSTVIRNTYFLGEKLNDDWVPSAVNKWIKENELYSRGSKR
jgi:nicotinate-nucleotide adenylyltransferase